MKSKVVALAFATVTAAVSLTAQSGIPDELFSEGERIWLGGEELAEAFAAGPRGELRVRQRTAIDWFLERGPGEAQTEGGSNPLDCLDFSVLDIQPSRAGMEGRANLWARIREAGLVAVGTVTERSAGLYLKTPYEMLVVQVSEWIKGGTGHRPETVYVPYPATHLMIAGRSVCSPHQRRVPPAPEVGARVLLVRWPSEFGFAGMNSPSVPIMNASPVLYEADGRLFLYDDFAEQTPGWDQLSFDEVVERARRLGKKQHSTPLVIGVNDNWRPMSSSLRNEAVRFDIDADGELEETAWILFDAAFLWLDRNANKVVDDASEFFGSHSIDADGNAFEASNGFDVLAAYDRTEYGGNGDGRIDRADGVWSQLLTWEDRNHDGVSQADEIARIRDYPRISHFLTEYRLVGRLDGSLNEITARSLFFVEGPGGGLRQRDIIDFSFAYNDEE